MTAQTTRVVTYCAVCDALETMHEIRADGSRGKRYGVSASSVRSATGGTAPHDPCPGYEPGRTEERPPEEELRRRLAAVVELHIHPQPRRDSLQWCEACLDWWPCPTLRAARGET